MLSTLSPSHWSPPRFQLNVSSGISNSTQSTNQWIIESMNESINTSINADVSMRLCYSFRGPNRKTILARITVFPSSKSSIYKWHPCNQNLNGKKHVKTTFSWHRGGIFGEVSLYNRINSVVKDRCHLVVKFHTTLQHHLADRCFTNWIQDRALPEVLACIQLIKPSLSVTVWNW